MKYLHKAYALRRLNDSELKKRNYKIKETSFCTKLKILQFRLWPYRLQNEFSLRRIPSFCFFLGEMVLFRVIRVSYYFIFVFVLVSRPNMVPHFYTNHEFQDDACHLLKKQLTTLL